MSLYTLGDQIQSEIDETTEAGWLSAGHETGVDMHANPTAYGEYPLTAGIPDRGYALPVPPWQRRTHGP